MKKDQKSLERPVGRPPKGNERLHINIKPVLAAKLRRLAEKDGQSLSLKIERTLELGLAK